MDENPVELNRVYAERALSRIRLHETFAAEQVASTAKWLTASLLAVNGGGAIAVLNQSPRGDYNWIAGLLFTSGIVFALLSGTALQEFYNRVSDPLLEYDKYWMQVRLTGLRDEQTESARQEPLNAINRFTFIPPLLGWISGILFIAGATLLAF